jgi:hypothetical protein
MAAIAFDTLAYVRRIVAAGVPREQAEAQADAMQEAFVHNIDALVTRDYLDTRFTEFETRVEANMDRRFTAMEINVDKRFTAIEASVDKRFVEAETRMDKHFSDFRLEMHGQISGVRGEVGELRSTQKLQSWMLALLLAGMLGPVVERLSGWL